MIEYTVVRAILTAVLHIRGHDGIGRHAGFR